MHRVFEVRPEFLERMRSETRGVRRTLDAYGQKLGYVLPEHVDRVLESVGDQWWPSLDFALEQYCRTQPAFRTCSVGGIFVAEDPLCTGPYIYGMGEHAIASSHVLTAMRFDAWMQRVSE